ncbi:MAG: sensor histidine kinase, partial [Pseudomonadales bacterium]
MISPIGPLRARRDELISSLAGQVILYLLFLFASICGPAFAAPVLEFNDFSQEYSLDDFADILEDPTGELSVSQLDQAPYKNIFAPNTQQRLRFGFTRSVYWLRFVVRNATSADEQFYLTVNRRTLQNLRLYDGASTALLYGAQPPPSAGELRGPEKLIKLGYIGPGESRRYYLQMASELPLTLTGSVFPSQGTTKHYASMLWNVALLFGAMPLALLATIMLGIALRSVPMFILCVYIVASSAYHWVATGFSLQVISDSTELLGSAFYLMALLLNIAIACFSYFLLIDLRLPKAIYRIHWLIVMVNAAAASLLLFFTQKLAFYTSYGLVWITFLSLFAVNIWAYLLKQHNFVLVILLSLGWTLMAMLAGFLSVEGSLANLDLSNRVLVLGGIIQILFMLVAAVQHHRWKNYGELRGQLEKSFAQRAVAYQSALLSRLTHQIRTPMSGILGMTELLRQTPLNATQQEYAHAIDSSGQELLNIVNDVTAYASIRSGNLPIQRHATDIRQLIDDSLLGLAQEAERKKVELVSQVDLDIPALIQLDPFRVSHVLTNLLAFSIAHTRDDEVLLTTSRQGDELQIKVQDRGQGISPAEQEELFADSQALNIEVPEKGGIGLPLARQIAEALGGSVKVSSSLAHGTTLELRLPLEEAAGVATEEFSAAFDLQNMHLLVVDDNKTCCDVV